MVGESGKRHLIASIDCKYAVSTRGGVEIRVFNRHASYMGHGTLLMGGNEGVNIGQVMALWRERVRYGLGSRYPQTSAWTMSARLYGEGDMTIAFQEEKEVPMEKE